MPPAQQILPRRWLLQRRLRNTVLMVLAVAAVLVIASYQANRLEKASYFTGVTLLIAVVFLAAYNLRKLIPVLPFLGSSAAWMQCHIYVGLGSAAVFLAHIGWKLPNGWFEQILALLYITTFFSGVAGLVWTRTVPKRLSALRDQFLFENIPHLRRDLAQQARTLLFWEGSKSVVLCRFYINRLASYFERPRSLAYLVHPTGATRRTLEGELAGLDRYLSTDQRQTSSHLLELVRKKDDLDFHFALQGRLKLWLFVHIGLTYSLLAFALTHAVVALAFTGAG